MSLDKGWQDNKELTIRLCEKYPQSIPEKNVKK